MAATLKLIPGEERHRWYQEHRALNDQIRQSALESAAQLGGVVWEKYKKIDCCATDAEFDEFSLEFILEHGDWKPSL